MLDNKRLNELQNNLKEELYELVSIFYEETSSHLVRLDREISHFIKCMYTNLDYYRADKERITLDFVRVETSFYSILQMIEGKFDKLKERRKEVVTKYFIIMREIPKNRRDYELLQFRCINIIKSLEYSLTLFSKEFMKELREVYYSSFDDLKKICIEFLEFLNNGNNEEDEEFDSIVYEIIEENDFYISKSDGFNYKDMCKLAESNGFKYKWSNGSHKIYEHSETHKGLVIPSHTLGLGLSKVIQRQIKNNSSVDMEEVYVE